MFEIGILQVIWGESSMIEAERLLLDAALEDPANQRFVLLSDRLISCIELVNEFVQQSLCLDLCNLFPYLSIILF
jgi:hypothetical protein